MGLHEYVKTCFQSNSSTRWIASSLPASPSMATQQKLLLLHPPVLLPALGMGTHVVPAGGKPALRKGAPKLQFSWQLQRSPLEQSLVTKKPSPVHLQGAGAAALLQWHCGVLQTCPSQENTHFLFFCPTRVSRSSKFTSSCCAKRFAAGSLGSASVSHALNPPPMLSLHCCSPSHPWPASCRPAESQL